MTGDLEPRGQLANPGLPGKWQWKYLWRWEHTGLANPRLFVHRKVANPWHTANPWVCDEKCMF